MENKEYIDLSILKRQPNLDTNIIMEICPLAPQSMVSELPGSFYKTLLYPSKKMICGLMENMLGWHFDKKTRTDIFNDWEKSLKRQKKDVNIEDYKYGSTYIPLLMDYFEFSSEIELVDFKGYCSYTDLWSRCYRRDDSYKHMNGCKNLDDSIIAKKYIEFRKIDSTENKSKEKNHQKDVWFKQHIGQVPCFYSTPTTREYVDIDAIYRVPLSIDGELSQMLKRASQGIFYLGNSEGWVNVSFKAI